MLVNVFGVRRNGERTLKPLAQVKCESLDDAEQAYRELTFQNPWKYKEWATLEYEDVATDELSELLAML